MIPVDRRAEKLCVDALLSDEKVLIEFGRSKIFQGFVAPNSLASLSRFIKLQRISDYTLDRVTDGTTTDRLRRVRLQIDVSEIGYDEAVRLSEMVRGVLESAFPSSISGGTYGTVSVGQKVFNVFSTDIILYETEV